NMGRNKMSKIQHKDFLGNDLAIGDKVVRVSAGNGYGYFRNDTVTGFTNYFVKLTCGDRTRPEKVIVVPLVL
ncbi:MAG: hypothetical protein QM489_00320, partial [Candidatus Izemoplasma sp.]